MSQISLESLLPEEWLLLLLLCGSGCGWTLVVGTLSVCLFALLLLLPLLPHKKALLVITVYMVLTVALLSQTCIMIPIVFFHEVCVSVL